MLLEIFLFVFFKTPFSCVLLHFILFMFCFSCKYVNIIAQNNQFRPYKSAFYLSIFALLRDEKMPSEAHFCPQKDFSVK